MKIMEHFTAAGASKCRLFLPFIIMIIMNTLPELNNDAFNSIEYVCLRRKFEGIERCLGIYLPSDKVRFTNVSTFFFWFWMVVVEEVFVLSAHEQNE